MPSPTNAPAPPPALVASAEGEKPYVLMKRGLYWRPDAQGYTGVLAEAGRYTAQKAAAYTDGGQDRSVVAILASEAEEFSPACWEETKLRVMRDRLSATESARDEAVAERDELRATLHEALHGEEAQGVLQGLKVMVGARDAAEAQLSAALARAERAEKALRGLEWLLNLDPETADVFSNSRSPDGDDAFQKTCEFVRRAIALAHPAPAEET